MRFEYPLALVLLLLAPLLLESSVRERFFGALHRRRERALSFASPAKLSEFSGGSRVRLRSLLLSILQVGAYLLLVLALARPQLGTAYRESEASARDIMLVLDLSGSMQAMDFFLDDNRVNRLVALQHVVKKFIDGREGDRMGLVVFGAQAFTQCPLTLDHNVLKEFVDGLEIGMAGPATAIGDALAVALKRTKDVPAKSKVLVLVTDGKSNAGSVTPEQATEIAKTLGVKIHVIGIGGNQPAPFPERTMFGTIQLVERVLEYDETTLKMIAENTGGTYFNAKNLEKLEQIYAEINTLEERRDRSSEYVEYSERFFPFVALGLALFLSAELLSATLLLRVP